MTETTFESEYGYKLPARVFSAERGGGARLALEVAADERADHEAHGALAPLGLAQEQADVALAQT